MAAYHVRGGKAAQTTGRAHRWTSEEVRAFREKSQAGLRLRYGEEALREFLNEMEGLMAPEPYHYYRHEVLEMFGSMMARRGYLPKGES